MIEVSRIWINEESCIDSYRNDKEKPGYIQCPTLSVPLTFPYKSQMHTQPIP